jgi:hypothetical protein
VFIGHNERSLQISDRSLGMVVRPLDLGVGVTRIQCCLQLLPQVGALFCWWSPCPRRPYLAQPSQKHPHANLVEPAPTLTIGTYTKLPMAFTSLLQKLRLIKHWYRLLNAPLTTLANVKISPYNPKKKLVVKFFVQFFLRTQSREIVLCLDIR